MFFLIIIILSVGYLIYAALNLDFELGTGFTEEKKNIREAEYTIVDSKKEQVEDKKILP